MSTCLHEHIERTAAMGRPATGAVCVACGLRFGPAPDPCRCIYVEHCNARYGCRLAAGGTINEGGGVCAPVEVSVAESRTGTQHEVLEHLTNFNECVRIYLLHRDAGNEVRSGWLEEEVAATDALLTRLAATPERRR